jgi:hypothetical protein
VPYLAFAAVRHVLEINTKTKTKTNQNKSTKFKNPPGSPLFVSAAQQPTTRAI